MRHPLDLLWMIDITINILSMMNVLIQKGLIINIISFATENKNKVSDSTWLKQEICYLNDLAVHQRIIRDGR